MDLSNLQLNKPTRLSIKFDENLAKLFKTLLKLSELPESPPTEHCQPWELGMELTWLKKLKAKLESDQWKVEDLEARINQLPHYFVRMKASADEGEKEFLDVHFVHVRSEREDAIPIVMQHGWPGTFWDFHKVVGPLVNPPPNQPAFHVILPSLPGFFLSTHPKHREWGIAEDAKLIHRLVTEVLGYKKYTAQAGDWGSAVFGVIGAIYASEVPLIHFNLFRAPPVPGISEDSLTEAERNSLRRGKAFVESGRGYFSIQESKPFTIGYAIQASPLSILAYIGEKFHEWSDPTVLDDNDLLDTTALYYLTRSFASSVVIYQESTKLKQGEQLKSLIGFTLFPYEMITSPKAYIEANFNLGFYKERTFGGHFPALDNPEGLVEDVREFIGKKWATV